MSSRKFIKYARPITYGSQGRARKAQAKVRAVRAAWKPAPKRSLAPEELKYYDTSRAGAVIAAATDATGGEYDPSATSMISTPAQGDGDQNRDGKLIRIKSVQVKGLLHRAASEDAANPSAADKVFLAIVVDTQSNAAQMNSEDCFINPAANVLTNAAPLRNLAGNKRFRVLKSEVFDFDARTQCVEGSDLFSNAAHSRDFDWFIPCDMEVNFNTVTPTVNTIASVVDNSIHVIAYSVAGAATISYNARIRFEA